MDTRNVSSFQFDFTPDPRVLIALSHTSMLPMDALCELIDNAIDSFSVAIEQGIEISNPTVWIDLPKKSDLDKGLGMIRIRDNGPGMTPEQAEKAIKAGYSSNNSFDRLGLFGMGFNISTSKFGKITRFCTARLSDDFFTETVIDLEKINETKNYMLEARKIAKNENFIQGTIIEISSWWPEGNANSGFVRKLIQYGKTRILQELGRRYATILRKKTVIIVVGGEPCEAFEHCVWGSNRYVERSGKQIPARFDIDELVGTKRRCSACRSIIPDNLAECPLCHSTSIRSIEERITGWVGIQRFDDASKYGIDLIRNGRAIRLQEKSAFFEYVDDLKNVIKDYPIDGPYGRIVGEINLDFVPVDFLKQDFQRSSDEWAQAMKVLRGESSLQPKQPGADNNHSYIFKLYQGYRKVREPGKADMYMGFWDSSQGKAKRIDRDKEHEYYEKFLKKLPGFYDDAEWWKLVEEASHPPVEPLVECPECQTQNLKTADICVGCGCVLKGKLCINPDCSALIPMTAVVCDKCGTSQIPEVETPWACEVCGCSNSSEVLVCAKCESPKGTPNPLSKEHLLSDSNKYDELSIESLTVRLADGSDSLKIKLETYFTKNDIKSYGSRESIPLLVFKEPNSFSIFMNPRHSFFAECRVQFEEVIANEIAAYIFDTNRHLVKYPKHSISSIAYSIIEKYWMRSIGVSFSIVRERCENLLNHIKQLISVSCPSEDASQLYSDMTSDMQKAFVARLFECGIGLDRVGELRQSGEYLRYVPSEFLIKVYDYNPSAFFNKGVWNVDYAIENEDINSEILIETYEQTLLEYRNSLETLVLFSRFSSNERLALRKVDAALKHLENKLEGYE